MKLTGLKVVDLSVFLPGPYVTQILADHGATVIKVESPHEGDPARSIGMGDGTASAFFWGVNRGKKSVALDLKTDDGKEALLRLCGDADVFIEAFRPGVMKRLGIDYEAIRTRNPKIVYCSISAFGQDGPYRDRPAHDLAVQALSGAQSLTVDARGMPTQSGIAIADISSGLQALAGILIGLFRARETGLGDYIDISMHEAVLSTFPNVLGPLFVASVQPVPSQERTTGGGAFYRIYETGDGRHIALGGQELKFCATLLEHFKRPDLIEFCRLPPGPGQAPVAKFLAERFRTQTLAEWDSELSTLNICYGPVKTLPEAFADPHLKSRDAILVDEKGRQHVAPVIRFLNEPACPDLNVPRLGEHTSTVFDSLPPTNGSSIL
ncbi:CaiB/BaiF CoA-transferase family protein [Aminobacter sp. MSH1]|uniref:CaiB/BaiF CoA transferase family protein n=1 Tax=Aminobacter sp. MSH1 TaxID=374606 RepID=UPI000D331D5F|nr:CaiB/BaiF CoA-transferase family protein [Aminobacter sp. MSH1]